MAHQHARMAIRRIISARHASSSQAGNGGHRKPMINFNAKSRHYDSTPGKPHPMAPKGIDFSSFGKGKSASTSSQSKASSTSSASSQSQSSPPQQQQKPAQSSKGLPPADFEEFFEMPKRYWQRPELEESEIEAIMTGGATLIR